MLIYYLMIYRILISSLIYMIIKNIKIEYNDELSKKILPIKERN